MKNAVDLNNGKVIIESISIKGNMDGVDMTLDYMDNIHEGLIVTEINTKLKVDDLLILTADHGCDPSTVSADPSREYIPILEYIAKVKSQTSKMNKIIRY